MNRAITTNMGNLMTVVRMNPQSNGQGSTNKSQMKAVKKFKRLTDPTRTSAPQTPIQSILGGDESYFVEPPMEMDPDEPFPMVGQPDLRAGIQNALRQPFARFRDPHPGSSDSISLSSRQSGAFEPSLDHASPVPSRTNSANKCSLEGTRGHARDPLEEEFPFLFIGPSTYTGSHEVSEEPAPVLAESDTTEQPEPIVSESPGAADFDIYETAYRSELERIKQSLEDQKTGPKVYLTRRVENRDEVMKLAKEKALNLQIGPKVAFGPRRAGSALVSAISALRSMQKRPAEQPDTEQLKHESKRLSVSGAEPAAGMDVSEGTVVQHNPRKE